MPERLPAHLAWPVKPAALTAALGAAAGAVDVVWLAQRREASARLFRATWAPERPSSIGARPGGGAGLWVYPVARAEVPLIRPLVLGQVLPEARAWLEDALAAGDAWQASRRERTWGLVNGVVEHRDREGVETLRDGGPG